MMSRRLDSNINIINARLKNNLLPVLIFFKQNASGEIQDGENTVAVIPVLNLCNFSLFRKLKIHLCS